MKKSYFAYISNAFGEYKKDILVISFLCFLVAIINMIPPFLLTVLVDNGLLKKQMDIICKYSLGILGLYIVCAIINVFKEKIRLNIYSKLIFKLRNNTINRILNIENKFFENINSSEIINTMEKDIQLITEMLGSDAIYLISSVLIALGGIVVLFLLSWQLTLIIVIFIILKSVITNILFKKNIKSIEQNILYTQEYGKWFGEFVVGIYDIKFLGLKNKKKKEFTKLQKGIIQSNRSSMVFNCINVELQTILIQLLTISIYIVSGIILINGNTSIGEIITFESYALMIATPLTGIIDIIYGLSSVIPSLKRYYSFFGDNNDSNENKRNIKSYHGNDILLDGVTFGYDSDSKVLDNCKMIIKQDEKIAITGLNGAGKSTIVKLLLNIIKPDEGRILIGTKDIQEYEEEYLYTLIGIVSQDIFLFNDTIKNNICGIDDISDERYRMIIRAVGLEEFVEKKGADFKVGENGNKLSGGQKQKIAIARILVKDPPIMIFDEPTSNLDKESLEVLCKLFKTLLYKTTVICVTHHEELLKHFDKVYQVKDKNITLKEKKNVRLYW